MRRSGPPPSVRHVVLGVVAAFVVATLGAGAWIAMRSYQREAAAHRPLRRSVPISDASALADVAAVVLDGPAGEIHGWYAPSRTGAAIVLVHGSTSDRRAVLPEAEILADAGYGVLLIDLPGHGESEGDVDWDGGARAAVVAAVDSLVGKDDVDPGRIGALGSSMGGFTVLQVAVDDARLAATVAVSAPHDQEAVTRWQNRRWGPLSELPAVWAMERAGLPRDVRRPIDEVAEIAPRGVLLVAGSADGFVPPRFTEALADVAGEGSELLVIEDAGHLGHVEVGGAAFRQALLDFYSLHFGGPAEPSRP